MIELLDTVFYIVLCVLLFAFAILIHEFGHFIVALKLGLRVGAFSIGFVTGSGTSANVLFGSLQAGAAAKLGVSADLLSDGLRVADLCLDSCFCAWRCPARPPRQGRA